jgi:hypothetical protein
VHGPFGGPSAELFGQSDDDALGAAAFTWKIISGGRLGGKIVIQLALAHAIDELARPASGRWVISVFLLWTAAWLRSASSHH